MIPAPIPENEPRRQKAVEKYGLLDTPSEENFDNITRLISDICDVPIALITLLDKDRNFLKSHYGVPFNESPREISFCGHAINSDEPIMIIEDSRKDLRFHDNPLVTDHNAIFYAGVPLVNSDGYKLGALCIYDNKPRTLTDKQVNIIIDLSKQVMSLYEQNYKNIQLRAFQTELEERNENLRKFARIVSHDLKSPLSNIVMLTKLLKEENENNLNEASLEYIKYLRTSSLSLSEYIDGLLEFYKSDNTINKEKEYIELPSFFETIKELTIANTDASFTYPEEPVTIYANKMALEQVFVNLVTNAIKYNSKGNIEVAITFEDKNKHYVFSVKDNGDGISQENLTKIFDIFTTLGKEDRDGIVGSGIGLATVKKIISSQEGTIEVNSEVGVGSEFHFTICKD